MKDMHIELVKKLGLKPLLNFDELGIDKEVFGVGWNGNFQKGTICRKNTYVYFKEEMGGVKKIDKVKACTKFGGKIVFPLKTVYSELYIKQYESK